MMIVYCRPSLTCISWCKGGDWHTYIWCHSGRQCHFFLAFFLPYAGVKLLLFFFPKACVGFFDIIYARGVMMFFHSFCHWMMNKNMHYHLILLHSPLSLSHTLSLSMLLYTPICIFTWGCDMATILIVHCTVVCNICVSLQSMMQTLYFWFTNDYSITLSPSFGWDCMLGFMLSIAYVSPFLFWIFTRTFVGREGKYLPMVSDAQTCFHGWVSRLRGID